MLGNEFVHVDDGMVDINVVHTEEGDFHATFSYTEHDATAGVIFGRSDELVDTRTARLQEVLSD